jgi:preprotein translocase subunit SecF
MKPIRLIPDDTKIQFMRLSRFGFMGSGLLCVASILLFIFVGLHYGIDFQGGITLTIRTEQPADLDQLRAKIDTLGLGVVELQEYGSPNDVLIRLPLQQGIDPEKAQQDAVAKVKQVLGPGVDYRSTETVGPKISGEYAHQSILAVLIAMTGVLIYIWFRFEWQFAVGAIVCLFHDILLTIGLFCLIKVEFNLSIIAALLTIVGYSLNDTVVVFDRIREYMRKYKQMPLADLIDVSTNSVLPRTILTSMTTLIALFALYLFGGEVIRGFNFAMIWGVFVGTYSSIFIASPILILLGARSEAVAKAPAKVAAPAGARP